MAVREGSLQFLLQLAERIFIGIENGQMPAYDLTALEAVNAFRPCIPGDNLSVHIQKEKRIVLQPRREWIPGEVVARGLGLVT